MRLLPASIALGALAASVAALVAATPAAAQGSAGCAATVGTQSTAAGTVSVGKDESVTVSGTAEPGAINRVFLEFFGKKWQIDDQIVGSSGIWSKTIDIPKYAKWGVGLYRLRWKTLPSVKEGSCTADIQVEGDFLGTRSAWAAMVMFAFGGGGILLTLHQAISFNKGGKWEVKAQAKVKRERDEQTGKVRLKASYSFSQTFVSALQGLVASGASLATLVGTATSPPTVTLGLSVTVPLTLASLGAGRLKLLAVKRAAERKLGLRPTVIGPLRV